MKYFIDAEFHEYHEQPKLLGIKIGKPIPTIDLISIGIVSEDIKYIGGIDPINKNSKVKVDKFINNRTYYAISKDFNIKDAWNSWQWDKLTDAELQLSKAKARQKGRNNENLAYPKGSYWLRDNVLKPIFNELWKRNLFDSDGNVNTKDHIDATDFTYKNFKYLVNKYGKTNKQIAEEITKFINEKSDGRGNEIEILGSEKTPVQFYGYYANYDWVVLAQLFGKMINLPKGFPMYCRDIKQTMDTLAEHLNPKGSKLTPKQWVKMIKEHSNYPKQNNEHNALADAKWNYELYKFLNKL